MQTSKIKIGRRQMLRMLLPMPLLASSPALAFDLFKAIDPEGKNKRLLKAKKILEGAGKIVASTGDVDYKTEFTVGESLAMEGFKRYGLPTPQPEVQKYLNLLGNAIARNSARPKIPFYITLVDSPLYNAFACPGGIIFLSSALFKSMHDEAELACVLAHEIAHVCHKHALSSIQRAQFFEGVAKITAATMKGSEGQKFESMIGDLQVVLFDKGLDKNMEYEADATGMELAYKTGYDPQGLIRVLDMLKTKEKGAEKKGAWFSTHPPLDSRLAKCHQKMGHYRDAGSLARDASRFNAYRKKLT